MLYFIRENRSREFIPHFDSTFEIFSANFNIMRSTYVAGIAKKMSNQDPANIIPAESTKTT